MEIVTPTIGLFIGQTLTFIIALIWLWAIIHILISQQPSMDKLFWLLAVILMPVIGTTVYLVRKVKLGDGNTNNS